MSSKVFVGNVSYDTTEIELESLFSEVGEVVQVSIPADRETGRPRGFAFVEFSDGTAAADAIEKFDGYEFKGRGLGVKEAIERQPRSRGFGDARPFGAPRGRKGAGKPKGSRRNLRSKKRGF